MLQAHSTNSATAKDAMLITHKHGHGAESRLSDLCYCHLNSPHSTSKAAAKHAMLIQTAAQQPSTAVVHLPHRRCRLFPVSHLMRSVRGGGRKASELGSMEAAGHHYRTTHE